VPHRNPAHRVAVTDLKKLGDEHRIRRAGGGIKILSHDMPENELPVSQDGVIRRSQV
jgi:hypothetical protein